LEEVNLYAIKEMQETLGLNIGYSDHTLGIEVSIAAAALGATVIEKHITIDKNLPGPDHKASLEPDELNDLVKQIRSISVAISGTGEKIPTSSELINKKHIRKSLNYANSFNKGRVLEESDFIALRPEAGINPMFIDNLIGKILNKSVKKFQAVKMKDFK
jgi:N-acetylneuraminate synthase/N,N'-diacetyllegionaminate synthase